MTKEIKLSAQTRQKANGKANQMRRQGHIPAVLYGSGIQNQNLKIKYKDFEKIFSVAGEAHLIDLVIDDKKPVKVIIKDAQMELTKDRPIHVDFYQVDMSKKITTEIPLHFIGDSRAVKELGGILIKAKDSIEIECLPGDLVSEVKVDQSLLNDLDDVIRIKDIKLPEGINFTGDENEALSSVQVPRVEEEVKEEAEEEVKEGEAEAEEKEGEPGKEKQEETEVKEPQTDKNK